jgi:hypothetical protein
MKPWQQGIELDVLKEIADRFKSHEKGYPLGAFSGVKENTVANWISNNHLLLSSDAAVVVRQSRATSTISDFRQQNICSMPAGSYVIDRVAGSAQGIIDLLNHRIPATAPVCWRSWAGHPIEQFVAQALSLRGAGTVIRASSEILTVYERGATLVGPQVSPADNAGIVPLVSTEFNTSTTPTDDENLALWEPIVQRLWVDHYSSYNKRRSWHAVALRSFGGHTDFIEKPSEMSKNWKQDNAEKMEWEIQDTQLFDLLPGARQLLAEIPADLERVRLMRLTQGGELSRHADITDRDAGTADGQIMRLHLPIKTHPDVRFQTWDLNNQPTTVHMIPGRWWYLDVRKPHQARNDGQHDRIHLVADAVANPILRRAIS